MKITEKQKTEWIEQHGGIYEFPVGDKTAFLRSPKMRDYKRAFSAMIDDGDIGYTEELLRTLWLAGDKEIQTNDDYFFSAMRRLKKLFKYGDAELTVLENGNTQITIGEHKCEVKKITRYLLKTAENKNPNNRPFVTQEKLFNLIVVSQDEVFKDRENANIRFPLYQAMEQMQNTKTARLVKHSRKPS